MGLDIFFSEDIRNALLAADEASTSTARVCAAVGGEYGQAARQKVKFHPNTAR